MACSGWGEEVEFHAAYAVPVNGIPSTDTCLRTPLAAQARKPPERRRSHGNVWQEGGRQGGYRNAREKGRYAEERPFRQDGQEPQAGHRHRPVRGAQGRRQGAATAEEERGEKVHRYEEIGFGEEGDVGEENGRQENSVKQERVTQDRGEENIRHEVQCP